MVFDCSVEIILFSKAIAFCMKGRRWKGGRQKTTQGAFGDSKAHKGKIKSGKQLRQEEKDKQLKFIEAVQELAVEGQLPLHYFTREKLEQLCSPEPAEVGKLMDTFLVAKHGNLLSVIKKHHPDKGIREKAKRLLKDLSQV